VGRYGFHKTQARTRYTELVFLYQVGFVGHVVHSSAPGTRIVDTIFFVLGWERYGFDKKCIEPRYAELLFFHLVGSAGHIVLSGEFRP
jgi:hypothetical protein